MVVSPLRADSALKSGRAFLEDGTPMTRVGSCFIAAANKVKDTTAIDCRAALYQNNSQRIPEPFDKHLDPASPLFCRLEMRKEHLEFADANGDPVLASTLRPEDQERYANTLARAWDNGDDETLKALAVSTGIRPGAIVIRSRGRTDPRWSKVVADEDALVRDLKRFRPDGKPALNDKLPPGFKDWKVATPP